jgi:hypothetical protein
MEALIAVAVVFFLVWAKGHATSGGDPTLTAAGSLTITASDAPVVHPNDPFAGGPIGNTFLSQSETVQHPDGSVIELPFRPSATYNGGGVAANYAELPIASAASVGSGIGAIEQINAPHVAVSAPAGGVSRTIVPPAFGGRSTLAGAQTHAAGITPAPPPQIVSPRAPVRVVAGPNGRNNIVTANTQGPRAGSNSLHAMPTAAGVDFHATPVVAPPQATPAQRALVKQITPKKLTPFQILAASRARAGQR